MSCWGWWWYGEILWAVVLVTVLTIVIKRRRACEEGNHRWASLTVTHARGVKHTVYCKRCNHVSRRTDLSQRPTKAPTDWSP